MLPTILRTKSLQLEAVSQLQKLVYAHIGWLTLCNNLLEDIYL
jgi:hypothetical protein